MAKNKDQIVEILKQCYDPEIPVDLWNLGLIYDIKINEKNCGYNHVSYYTWMRDGAIHGGRY